MRSTSPALLCLLLLWTVASASAEKDKAKDPKVTVKLVEYIQKKNFDAFTSEIATDTMDVNQPTPNGKIPIIEAVKAKDLKFVDALIQYYATINVKEPGTGASPIMLAFQNNLVEISKLLLAYGADPTVAAKNGKKASDVMTSSAIKELHATWEKSGAIAFEDAPGTWKKAKNDEDVEYWFNSEAKEGRWNMPPSCAWQRVETQDGPPQYVNYVTSQSVHYTPPALCWRKVRQAEGAELWFNWAINITQYEDPEEMPQYLLEEAAKMLNVRWYNEKTQQFSWEDPKNGNHWRPITENDKTYYYNVVTGDTQWDVPDELAWAKQDSDDGPFWYNSKTGDSTWELPEVHAWVRHDHEL